MKYLIITLVLMASINSASALNQLKNYEPGSPREIKLLEWDDNNHMSKMTMEQRNTAWVSYIEGAKASPLVEGGPEQNYSHFCEKTQADALMSFFTRARKVQ